MSDEQARIAELELEAEEADKLRESMGDKLTRVANVLKGTPPPFTLHSWHDLPEVAEALERDLAVVRANHAAASERARNTCACKFDDDGNEPVRQCDYHATQARDLAAARERVAELEGDPAEAIAAGMRNAIPELLNVASKERIAELEAEIARLRRALDAAGLVRLLQWAQERLEHWTEYTANSPVWDADEPEDAEQMDQDRRALVAIKSALSGLVLSSDDREEAEGG